MTGFSGAKKTLNPPGPYSPASIQTLFAPAIPSPSSSLSTIPRTVGMLFTVSKTSILSAIWAYSGTGCTVLPSACGIFMVNGQTIICQNSSPTWTEAAGTGWTRCDMSSFNVTLFPGIQYQVVIGEANAGEYALVTSGYFGSSGPGQNGATTGSLTAPGGGSNPGWFSTTSSFSYPGTTGANENFWIDVEVYTPSGLWSSATQLGSTAFGSLTVSNNVWNTSLAGPQVTWANSPSDWGFMSIQGGASPTAVKSYPSVYQLLGNPVSSYTNIKSSYNVEIPSSGVFIGDIGWDCWINNYAIEVFFVVFNIGQILPGSIVGTYESGGDTWTVYEINATHFNMVKTNYGFKGTVNLLEGFQWLVANSFVSGSLLLNQVGFGIEVCSTGNQPMSFKVNGYSQVCQ